jgi:peptidoglycan hydrolase-like protein with peptidoglycan-binding domain
VLFVTELLQSLGDGHVNERKPRRSRTRQREIALLARRGPFQSVQEHAALGVRYNHVTKWFVLAVAIVLAVAGLVSTLHDKHISIRRGEEKPSIAKTAGVAFDSESGWADDNVRAVQTKLRDGSFYSGEIDGAYSSELAAALTRYQIRNGLPITGRLDIDTGEALGAKPAVTTTLADSAQSSETWLRLRKGDQQTFAKTNARETSSPPADQSTAAESSSVPNVSTERLRDYVGAFVLAGLDPHVGAEADFFADRVHYYDQGMMSHEKIRQDLQRYAARWPERRFSLAGEITVEPQNGNRVRVTFPLRYELRNGAKYSSGKIDKTLVLEPAGNDLAIVAVNERKAD